MTVAGTNKHKPTYEHLSDSICHNPPGCLCVDGCTGVLAEAVIHANIRFYITSEYLWTVLQTAVSTLMSINVTYDMFINNIVNSAVCVDQGHLKFQWFNIASSACRPTLVARIHSFSTHNT